MDAKHIRILHDTAMMFAQDLEALRLTGKPDEAKPLLRAAFYMEREALRATATDNQPGHAILSKSSGHLALDCGMPSKAEAIAAHGVDHAQHCDLKQELLELLTKAAFNRIRLESN